MGPVYNVDPQRRAAYAGSQQGFSPVERELVFDIDLTDYDDVRTCGQGGHICNKCWPLMAVAIQLLDAGLREDFGFQHVLYVFSGRRGVHAWVCDERARTLTDEQRSAVASYFSVYKGQEKGAAKLATTLDDHPSVSRAYEILLTAFEEFILPNQALLEDASHQDTVLGYVPSDAVRASIKHRWTINGTAGNDISVRRWHIVKEEIAREKEALLRGANSRSLEALRSAKQLEKGLKDIILAYAYPRLDVEVSKKMNHLLKAPFCVHPKTGKICVPIDPARAWEFDPDSVATVGGVLNQLNDVKGAPAGEEWRSTDMAEAVTTFRSCLLDGLMTASKESLNLKARAVASVQPALAW